MAKKTDTYKLPNYITNPEVGKYVTKVIKKLKEKGLFEETDKLIIDTLASNYQILIQAYEAISKDGLTQTDRYGKPVISTYMEVKKVAENQLNKCIQQLGLSAKSRKQINSNTDDEIDLEALLND